MKDEQLRKRLTDLFSEAGKAHHEAFAASGGEDPDWAIWYASFLQQPLEQLLGRSLTRSRIVYCLMETESDRSVRSPDAAWADYYADHFLECFAPSATPAEDKLALYHFRGCGFCTLVTRTIDRLGIDVEMRDIHRSSEYRDELIAVRGRSTVPVLRITAPDGDDRWMPESRDIVAYLERTYGD